LIKTSAPFLIANRYETFACAPEQTTISAKLKTLGRFNSATDTVTPRVQVRNMAGLTRGDWATTLVLQHVSGYTDEPIEATDLATGSKENVTRQVRAFRTLDAFARWAVQKMYRSIWAC